MSLLSNLSDETRAKLEKDPKVAFYLFSYLAITTPLEFQSKSYEALLHKISTKLKRSDVESIKAMVEIHVASIGEIYKKF